MLVIPRFSQLQARLVEINSDLIDQLSIRIGAESKNGPELISELKLDFCPEMYDFTEK